MTDQPEMMLDVSPISSDAIDELYRAVHNTAGATIVDSFDNGYLLKGTEDTFNALREQLTEQVAEEKEYEQYMMAEANQDAKQALETALREQQD